MKVLICGSGLLGKYLHSILAINNELTSYLISLKESNFNDFKNKYNLLDKNDILIDSMDPNNINNDFDIQVNKKAIKFRNYALKNSSQISYFYISTANLYEKSLSLIDERSELKKNFSPYLKMKLNSENLVKKYCKSNFAILRIVNIWSNNQTNSFFGDLINAKNKNLVIDPRKNDEDVISYANIHDICKLIEHIIISQNTGIINISTNCFDTRENLKARVNSTEIMGFNNREGYRIHSKVINWKMILKNKKELF